ncbi:11007_t:CDS:2 [Dentiscutata erythropus]|uniref:11007_t:CDS:1 n=1 Tax=Dentiscutata erythropus TaxID=1348616 RepID=A0A9N9GPL3_9GLOM|nr:11007_t:CDS:2 [Dentiscutata erythropus]
MPRPRRTRVAKLKKVADDKDKGLTESSKNELSESEIPKKRQRKAEISKESVRASSASDNITDADYIQANNTYLTSEEAIQQQTSNDNTTDKLENNSVQLQKQQNLTYDPQYQRQPSIHGHGTNTCSTPFANHNQQMYCFLELPCVNKREIEPLIDPSLEFSNESQKYKRPLCLNNTSYMNDSLYPPKTYMIANPLFLPYSSNHVPNYYGQHQHYITNNSQNITESQQTQVKQPTVLCSSVNHSKSTNDQQNGQGLFFPNEAVLIEWLRTREDLILQVQQRSLGDTLELLLEQCKLLFLRTRYPHSKARETLVEKIATAMDPSSEDLILLKKKSYIYFNGFRSQFNRDIAFLAKSFDPTDEDIKKFVANDVWQQKFNRFLEVTNYAEFKKSTSFKSLEIFVIECLKIHIAYLIAVRNKEKPSYQEDVLDKIKSLNQLTAHIYIPVANNYNYVNELDLDNNDD